MDVTKLTSGYKLRLTDSEYEALELVVKFGYETAINNTETHAALSGTAKTALRRFKPEVLAVTDDRRSARDA